MTTLEEYATLIAAQLTIAMGARNNEPSSYWDTEGAVDTWDELRKAVYEKLKSDPLGRSRAA